MEAIMAALTVFDDFVWGPPMMVVLVGTGLYITARIRGTQFTKLGRAIKMFFGGWRGREKGEAAKGDITPFQSLSVAISGTVGNGNIAGVATAIAMGGPGAAFWMWITALVGMGTKFAEASLAVRSRVVDVDGTILGGPFLTIERLVGSKWKWLAILFAFFGAICGFGIGNAVQTNSMALVLNEYYGIPFIATGITLAILIGLVVVGGIKRIGRVAEYLSPWMCVIYIIGAIIVLLINITALPAAFGEIFKYAFTPRAAFGGFVGATVMRAMRFGVARGIFSNEAGLGTGGLSHSPTRIPIPARQGSLGFFEVFLDTIVVCSMTALVILTTGALGTGLTSTALTAWGFRSVLGGAGVAVTAAGSLLFGYSTLLSWYYYSSQCGRYLFGKKVSPGTVKRYKLGFGVAWVIFAFMGGIWKVDFVWLLTDALNGAMAIPNLISLLILGGLVGKIARDYFVAGKEEYTPEVHIEELIK
ncbi:MAG: sodium:alanine symporter family protein [Dehalococcoidia bacterium]|nr:sodium:alanine symporter family protein [Dehalococcoidia bacterium]